MAPDGIDAARRHATPLLPKRRACYRSFAMSRDEVLSTLRDILTTNFGVASEKVTPEASFRGTFGLDSLDIVDLVYFLQKSFTFEADLDEYRDLHTVAKVIDFVLEKRGT